MQGVREMEASGMIPSCGLLFGLVLSEEFPQIRIPVIHNYT